LKLEGQDVKKIQGCEEQMERSKKSDEELRAVSTTLDVLLIGRNFWRKKAS
jgi:hypothetical protein